jgi:hypothetical protein
MGATVRGLEGFEMSERGGGKSRKSPSSKAAPSKASASKTSASKTAAKKAGAPARTPRGAAAGKGRAPARRTSSENGSALEAPALLARVVKLESERDRLRAELEKAESRIRALEEGRDQVLNRIDWVIDSLRNLIDGGQ